MVKIAKFFGYLLFFLAMVLFFLPKIELFYLAEKQLEPFKVIISDEKLHDSGFSLEVQDAKIYFEGIESAYIEELKITPWVFANSVTLQNIKLSHAAKSFVPLDVEFVELRYHIFNPIAVSIYAKGGFGELHGKVDLVGRTLMISLSPSAKMTKEYAHTLRNLKKEKSGEYSYAKDL
jgi:hypothetical protein